MIVLLLIASLLYITVTPSAIHALLALILLFINFALLLFSVDSAFLAFAYILVYIGAICVLFLYIILLLHLRSYSLMQRTNLITLILFLFMFVIIITMIQLNTVPLHDALTFDITYLSDLQLFASYLYMTHQHYMFLSIIILLLALFLSVFLSTRYLSTTKNLLINL